jgi:hypothetical protein
MTNPSPDWLDDVLRSRPVDDDGFSARVTGLGRGEVRTGWLVRTVIALVVFGGIATCSGAELFILGAMFDDDDALVDGRVWVDEQRADWARVVAAFDAHPALRRRAGRDASTVLNFAIEQMDRQPPANHFACQKEAGHLQANREDIAALGVCDTSWIVGLSAYDVWTVPSEDFFSQHFYDLLNPARAHLRRAASQPLVPDMPAPFAVAARDVEALGRLALTHSNGGARFFAAVASEHERAAAAGRAGDHILVVDEDDAALLQRAWFAGIIFVGPAATDDDVANVGRMQSVLACGALSDAWGLGDIGAHFLDDHRIERLRVLDRTGCGAPRQQALAQRVCSGLPPNLCRLVLAPSSLPPFRQRVVQTLEHWNSWELNFDKTPTGATTTSATAPAERP